MRFSSWLLWSKRVFHFPCTGHSSVFPEVERPAHCSFQVPVANLFSTSVVFFIISVVLFCLIGNSGIHLVVSASSGGFMRYLHSSDLLFTVCFLLYLLCLFRPVISLSIQEFLLSLLSPFPEDPTYPGFTELLLW